jgi:two-component system chemotaxis response regulator CheY
MCVHQAVGSRQGRVLLVDDEEEVRKPIRLTLTKAGYEVVEAFDGEQAIRLLSSGDNPLVVDAILCDLSMPRMNGLDAIQHFRNEFPSIPVVVLTGFPDFETAVALMKQGVRDYLVKPAPKEELLRILTRAVSEHEIFKA